MKRFVCVFAVAAGVAVRSDALMYTTERLNDFAVRGGNGHVIAVTSFSDLIKGEFYQWQE